MFLPAVSTTMLLANNDGMSHLPNLQKQHMDKNLLPLPLSLVLCILR